MKGIPRNVGGPDRAVRIGAGLALLLLQAVGLIGWWGLIGGYLLLTGLVGREPLYRLVGLDSGNYPHYRM